MHILSLDGGGYLGLATASFIRAIERYASIRFAEHFELFCGTSTGALIALALASGKTGDELVELYRAMGSRVFAKGLRPRYGLLGPKYRNTHLRQVLEEQFGAATLGDALKRGKKVLVTAFNISTGKPRIFKTDHAKYLKRDSGLTLVDVAMASTAAPLYFPLVTVTNPHDGVPEAFCDGGVVANHPALLGYAEAVAELGVPTNKIRLLSISTPRTDLAEGVISSARLNRGLFGWRKKLPSILIDGPSMAAQGILDRISRNQSQNGLIYERVELENRGLAMDCVTEEATKQLEHIGFTKAADVGVRKLIEPILTRQGE